MARTAIEGFGLWIHGVRVDTIRAGTPAATAHPGTSSRTTAPAPITACGPIATPSRILAPAPAHTPSAMLTPDDVRGLREHTR